MMEQWGIAEDVMDDDEAPMWFIHKMMSGQTLYDRKNCPEAQYMKLLRARKDAALKKRGEGDRAKRDYILKIVMHDIKDDNNEDLIWRLIKVSGGMKVIKVALYFLIRAILTSCSFPFSRTRS
jgi:hypothetical protein